MAGPTAVYLEVGARKVFAAAADWPGWCRAGRTEEQAIEMLGRYAERYSEVPAQVGVPFPKSLGTALDVVERLPGDATTDFGAPSRAAAGDSAPLTAAAAARVAGLVGGCWEVFDRIVAQTPAELRKGPRGGGRDRDAIIDHVLGAEAAYARKLGVRHRPPALADAVAVKALRHDLLAVLSQPSDGAPLVPKGWLPRYAARRIVWHVLDHAWEMQDRTER
jgi:hypothetical protein